MEEGKSTLPPVQINQFGKRIVAESHFTRSRRIVTSGATRTKLLLQKSYFGLRSSSIKVTNAPQG